MARKPPVPVCSEEDKKTLEAWSRSRVLEAIITPVTTDKVCKVTPEIALKKVFFTTTLELDCTLISNSFSVLSTDIFTDSNSFT